MKKLPVLLIVIAVAFGALAVAGLLYGLALAILPVAAAGAFFTFAVAAQILSVKAPRFYKPFARVTAVVLSLAVVMCAVASGLIFTCYFDDEVPDNTTAIVLGCGLSQHDQTSPSLMLSRRLRAAEAYMLANPGAAVILSGGQGANEKISEAEAMYRYFEARGFDMSNIFMENKSVSTGENIAFSAELAETEGIDLSGGVVIVTDGFHQFRAQRHARSLGLTAFTVASQAPVALQIFYWAREIPGIVFYA